MSRRKFLKTSALGVGGILLAKCVSGAEDKNIVEEKIHTAWNHVARVGKSVVQFIS